MAGETRPPGDRAGVIQDFLSTSGFAKAALDWLAADASFRRYGRLGGGPRPALIMDAPPEHEDVRPWLRVARHLVALGLSAPVVIAEDATAGLLLIEDFGDDTFTRLLNVGTEEHALYDLAIDVLAALHEHPADQAAPGWLPVYDRQRLLDEAALFTDWYLPALRGQATGPTEREDYLALMGLALAPAETGARTLVLRDYHVDNLMLLKGRKGIVSCGLLDFQDAVAGHPAYDLISLIEDARRDLGPDVAARAEARYFAARAIPEPEDFAVAAAVLAAARNAKIIGIFTRLALRDGKHRYLAMIPRVWRHLEGDLAHPALGPLAAWFDAVVPRDARAVPTVPKETS
ncbi:MAG: aminoglycoside/choline kinase family phosphotransferase [Alphaproteobacteria bacterium]|jgi:aminoglycoside/choline kinase family phosphotransferase